MTALAVCTLDSETGRADPLPRVNAEHLTGTFLTGVTC
jgi:hypothetical protein